MRMTRNLSAAALALAASSVVAHAQTVASTFTDNFDDGLGASRWTFAARENNIDPTVTAADATVNFNFDYAGVTYESNVGTVATGSTPAGTPVPIPLAPGGGGTKAVQIHVNDGGAPNNITQAAITPTLSNVSANFIMKADMFLNYNSPSAGSGSTESYLVGLNANADGSGVAGDNLTGGAFAGNNSANGYAFAGSSDGDNAGDYRIYARQIPGDDGPNYSKVNGTWTGTSRQPVFGADGLYTGVNVGPAEANGGAGNGGTVPYRGFTNSNTYFRDELFPSNTVDPNGYEVAGVVGKHWVQVQVEQHGKIALYTINGHIISHLFLPSSTNLTGKPELGLVDLTAGQPDNPTDSYVLYDNVSITDLAAATANTIPAGSTYVTFNAGGTVTNTQTATVNGITLDTTPTTLAGTGAITLGSTTTGSNYGAIWSGDGAQVITKPISIQSDSAIYVDKATDSLTITNLTTNPSYDLTTSGLGKLTIPAGFNTKSFNISRLGRVALSGTGGSKTTLLNLEAMPALTATAPLPTAFAQLDFGRSVVAVDYSSAGSVASPAQPLSPLPFITLYLNSGFTPDANGAFTGTGLTSSAPEIQGALFGDATNIYTVRVAEASAAGYTNGSAWLGKTIDATTVLFGFTFKADFNIDQTINFTDLLTLAKNYGQSIDNSQFNSFLKGDSNGDGTVDFTDLLNLAKNYGKTIGSSSPAASSEVFAADWALAQALAPEPATLTAILGLGGLAMGRRRR